MNKVFKLLKCQYMNSLGLTQKKNKSGVNFSLMFLYLLTGTIFIGLFLTMFSSLVGPLKELKLPLEFIPFMAFISAAGMVIMTDIVKSAGTIYNVKDFQLLSVLPISGGKIITAKILDVLLSSYLFFLVFMIPSYIIYFGEVGFSINKFLIVIILFLAGPLIPMCIGIGLGYILFRVSAKFKFKDMAMTIIYLIVSFGFLIMVYTAQKWLPWFMSNMQKLVEGLLKLFVIMNLFLEALIKGSISKALIFFLISFAVFLIFLFIIKNTFFKVNSDFLVFGKSEDKTIKISEKKGVIVSLMKIEFLRLVSKAAIILNVLSTGALFIIFIVIISLNLLSNMTNTQSMILAFGILTFGMAPTTATSISLEGKSFEIKKALPIRTIDIIKAKIYLNLLVNAPFLILGVFVAMLMGALTLSEFIIMLITLAIVLLFSSIYGLLINMKYYNFNWTSEAQVVKRSASVIFTMIPTMIGFMMTFNMTLIGSNGIAIFGCIYFIALIIVLILIKLYGVKMYEDIGSN
ncbi:MAG: hypothetical protein ACRCYE_08410 [Sarcina sp.]